MNTADTPSDKSIICNVCFRHCHIQEDGTGYCRVRGNRDGKNVPLNYGRLTSLALDPVEKKPLRRFHAGSFILSAGSFGCNLSCPFCQNHEISMAGGEQYASDEIISPEDLAARAAALRSRGNIGLAFTYNEPLISYEYYIDCAKEIHRLGMKSVLVSNGTTDPDIFKEVISLTDAANIDLKGFTEDYYRSFLHGDLNQVLANIQAAAECPTCHLELTTLIVPGYNDSVQDMKRQAEWISNLPSGKSIPLHISRFFPRYKMTGIDSTPVSTIYKLKEAAESCLDHVYTGNC